MVVVGFLLIILGIATIATPAGWFFLIVGAVTLTLDKKFTAEMQAGEVGNGCLNNLVTLGLIVFVLWLLAAISTGGAVTHSIDRNVNGRLEQFNDDYRARPNYRGTQWEWNP